MKEIKFNSRSELYAWASTGKVIARSGFTYKPNEKGLYTRNSGELCIFLDFAFELSEYIGIEETPVRKLYAFRDKNDSEVFFCANDKNCRNENYKRAPEFDLTFPEKEGE